MATPNFILSPGITLPASLVPVSTPPLKLTDVDDFLMSQDRSARLILPDGNCLFRALSHQLYGCEEYHVELRNMLLHVLQGNITTYKSFWIEDTPQGKVTFQEHLKNLTKLGSWGTQVEIQAASDCFNIVCSSNPSGIIRWERKAVPINHGAFVYTHSMPTPMLPFTINHMELSFSQNHYNSVIPTEKGTKLMSPVIIQRHSDCIIVPDQS